MAVFGIQDPLQSSIGQALGQASRTLGASTAAGASSFFAFDPVSLTIQAITFGFSKWAESKARSQAKHDARDQTAVKIKNVQPVEANETIGILYGTSATKGHRCFIHVQQGGRVPVPRGVTEIGRIPFDQDQRGATTINSHPTEFYMAQYVLSLGDTGRILGLQIDGRDVKKSWTANGLRGNYGGTLGGCWQLPYQTASQWAIGFARGRRTTNSTYQGCTYADGWAQLPDSKNGKYRVYRGKTPVYVFHKQGRLVRVMVNGAPSTMVMHTDNNAAILLDYLTSDLYGPGLRDSQIDMPSFQAYYDLCERSLLNSRMNPGSVDPVNVPVDCYQEALRMGLLPRDRNVWESFVESCMARDGYSGGTSVPGSSKALRTSLGQVRWGAYNGIVDSALAYQDAVEQIIQPVPGVVVGEIQGKIYVIAHQWDETAADASMITLTDPMLPGPINKFDPDPEGSFNTYHVTYNDIDKDFHENTETWTDNDLVEADGGELLEYEERVPGICTAVQARTLARSRCLLSRRRIFKGTYNLYAVGGLILSGTVFRVQSTEYGVDSYMVMGDFDCDAQTGICEFDAVEFNPLDYGPLLAARFTEFSLEDEPVSTGAFIRITGVPNLPVKSGTTLKVKASVVGSDESPAYQFEGEGIANTMIDETDWSPTEENPTLKVTAFLPGCDLTAETTVMVANAVSPTVEITAKDNGKYTAITNAGTAETSLRWNLDPPAAGTLSSRTDKEVEVTNTLDSVRGELRVRATFGSQTADDIALTPYHALTEDHGLLNTVNGDERVV